MYDSIPTSVLLESSTRDLLCTLLVVVERFPNSFKNYVSLSEGPFTEVSALMLPSLTQDILCLS